MDDKGTVENERKTAFLPTSTFAPTVNILTSSSYTLPIDYPDSPSSEEIPSPVNPSAADKQSRSQSESHSPAASDTNEPSPLPAESVDETAAVVEDDASRPASMDADAISQSPSHDLTSEVDSNLTVDERQDTCSAGESSQLSAEVFGESSDSSTVKCPTTEQSCVYDDRPETSTAVLTGTDEMSVSREQQSSTAVNAAAQSSPTTDRRVNTCCDDFSLPVVSPLISDSGMVLTAMHTENTYSQDLTDYGVCTGGQSGAESHTPVVTADAEVEAVAVDSKSSDDAYKHTVDNESQNAVIDELVSTSGEEPERDDASFKEKPENATFEEKGEELIEKRHPEMDSTPIEEEVAETDSTPIDQEMPSTPVQEELAAPETDIEEEMAAPETDSTPLEQEMSVTETDRTLIEQEMPVLATDSIPVEEEMEVHVPETDSTPIEQEMAAPETDGTPIEQEMPVLETDSTPVEEEMAAPETGSTPIEEEMEIPETDSTPVEEAMAAPETDSTLVEEEMAVPETDSSPIEKEMRASERECSSVDEEPEGSHAPFEVEMKSPNKDSHQEDSTPLEEEMISQMNKITPAEKEPERRNLPSEEEPGELHVARPAVLEGSTPTEEEMPALAKDVSLAEEKPERDSASEPEREEEDELERDVTLAEEVPERGSTPCEETPMTEANVSPAEEELERDVTFMEEVMKSPEQDSEQQRTEKDNAFLEEELITADQDIAPAEEEQTFTPVAPETHSTAIEENMRAPETDSALIEEETPDSNQEEFKRGEAVVDEVMESLEGDDILCKEEPERDGSKEKLETDSTLVKEELKNDVIPIRKDPESKRDGTPSEEEIPQKRGCTPSEEEIPEKDSTPLEEEIPERDSTPLEEEIPEKDSTPLEEEIPERDSTPSEEEIPEKDSTHLEEEIPERDDTPSEEEIPEKNSTPLEEEMPERDSTPLEEEMPERENEPESDGGSVTPVDEGKVDTTVEEVTEDNVTIKQVQDSIPVVVDRDIVPVQTADTPLEEEMATAEKDSSNLVEQEPENSSALVEEDMKSPDGSIEQELDRDNIPAQEETATVEKNATPFVQESETDSTPVEEEMAAPETDSTPVEEEIPVPVEEEMAAPEIDSTPVEEEMAAPETDSIPVEAVPETDSTPVEEETPVPIEEEMAAPETDSTPVEAVPETDSTPVKEEIPVPIEEEMAAPETDSTPIDEVLPERVSTPEASVRDNSLVEEEMTSASDRATPVMDNTQPESVTQVIDLNQSSETETGSETETTAAPETENLSQTVPKSADSLPVTSSIMTRLPSSNTLSSLFSTLPPFSSISASPISLPTVSQQSSAFSSTLVSSPVSSTGGTLLQPPLTFGNYRKLPHQVSVLSKKTTKSSVDVSTAVTTTMTRPVSSQTTTPKVFSASSSCQTSSVSSDVTDHTHKTSRSSDSPPQTGFTRLSSSQSGLVSTYSLTTITAPTTVLSAPTVTIPEPDWMTSTVKEETEEVVTSVDEITAQQLKLAQQKLAMLQKHSFSPLYKPTDLSSLERVGSDSQQTVFWYDGGRNLYQSPPVWDPTAKPKESELVLVCKSFIQWQNKLKQLRSSCHEADSKLAQIIKQNFLSRVKIATKRKPKDASGASHHQQQRNSASPLTAPSITQSITTVSTPSLTASSIVSQGLPQGSILVVPSSTVLPQAHGFSGVPLLPVFANTAVILPQSVQAPPSQISSTQFTVNPAFDQAQIRAKSQSSTSQQSGGSHGNRGEQGEERKSRISKEEMIKDQDEVIIQRIETPQPTYHHHHSFPISMATKMTTPTPAHTFLSPPVIQLPSFKENVETIKLQPHPLFSSRVQAASAYNTTPFAGGVEILKVEPEAEMGSVDKNTKSLEILEEVPIRMVSIEASNSIPEGVLPQPPSKAFADKGISPYMNQREPVIKSHAPPIITEQAQSFPLQSSLRHLPTSVPAATATPVVTVATTASLSVVASESRTVSESSAIVALTELAAQQGRTTQEVMSAKTLLSLYGPGGQPLSATPTSDSTPTRSKKAPRKQKPVASARASPPTSSSIGAVGPVTTDPSLAPVPLTADVGGAKGRKRDYTPEELLKILDIPGAGPSIKHVESSETRKQIDHIRGGRGTQDKGAGQTSVPSRVGKASEGARSRESEPESESSDSSSGSESSTDEEEEVPLPAVKDSTKNISNSTNLQLELSSSSDTTSEEEEEEQVAPPPPKKGRGQKETGRAQGRGGTRSTTGMSRSVRGRVQKLQRSSVTTKGQRDIAKALKDRVQSSRGSSQQKRGRGGPARPPPRQQQRKVVSLVVSISRRALEEAERRRKELKRKLASDSENETEYSSDSDASPPPVKVPANSKKSKEEPSSALPMDLTKYYKSDHVDLETLSELTQSVVAPPEGKDNTVRSKRTCVRVREEITKLQELLNANGEKIKPATQTKKSQTQSNSGAIGNQQKSISAAKATATKQSSRSSNSGHTPASKRKKGAKSSDQEASDTVSRKSAAATKLKYVFSTQLANQAAEAVWRSKFENIISFHKAQQTKGPGFLRLPNKETLGGGGSRNPFESNKLANLRPRGMAASKNAPKSSIQRGKAEPQRGQGNQRGGGGLRRSRRLAQTKEVKEEVSEESGSDEEDDEENEEEDESSEEEEEETKQVEKENKSKLTRVAIRKRRSPDIATPPSNESSESNEEDEMPPAKVSKQSEEVSPVDKQTAVGTRPSSKTLPPQSCPPQPVELQAVASRDQTPVHTPVDTPVQSQSNDEVNYTICHGTTHDVQPSSTEQQPISSSQTLSHAPTTQQGGNVAMATGGGAQWSGGSFGQPTPFNPTVHAAAGGYHQLYNKLHPAAAAAMYSHQQHSLAAANYPYQMHYPWPHPPPQLEHAEHAHPTSSLVPGWAPGPPSTQAGGREVSKSADAAKLGQYYGSHGKHASAGSGHRISTAPFSFPPVGVRGVHHAQSHHERSSFPYGFEPHPHQSLAGAHMWGQPPQLPHAAQLHSLVPHPHLASQGLSWPYPQAPPPPSGHSHHPSHHLAMQQHHAMTSPPTEKAGSKGRKAGGEVKATDLKLNSNHNNSNDSGGMRSFSDWPVAAIPLSPGRKSCDKRVKKSKSS